MRHNYHNYVYKLIINCTFLGSPLRVYIYKDEYTQTYRYCHIFATAFGHPLAIDTVGRTVLVPTQKV